MTMRSATYTNTVELIPLDLSNKEEYDQLQTQRKLCGWKFSTETLDFWKWLAERNWRTMFWIVISSESNVRAGHISLDCASYTTIGTKTKEALETEIPDRTNMTIATFYLLPEYQSKGVGRVAMDMLENLATKEPYGSPDTKAILVDTFPTRFCQPETFRQAWRDLGIEPKADLEPHWPDAAAWYARRGYVWYKEQPSYEDTIEGTAVMLPGAYFRKDLQ